MIDINVIKAGGKFYSGKCSLLFDKDERGTVVTAKILNVDLVEPNGPTSYRKIKGVFHTEGFDVLSRMKYQNIYDALTKKLIQKFKMSVLNI